MDDPLIISATVDGIHRRTRAGWEQARMIVSCWSKNASLIEFPWEKQSEEYTDAQREIDMQASLEAMKRMHPEIEFNTKIKW